MNCCDNKDENKNDENKNDENKNDGKQKMKHKGHMPHMLMMILCCGAPILILFLLPFISSNVSPTTRNSLIAIVPFICPIMMMFMIPMMMRGNKEKQAGHNHRELGESEDISKE